MKKIIVLVGFAVMGVLAYFLMRDSDAPVLETKMVQESVTQKVLKPTDYKINQDNKVVKAIVADSNNSKAKIISKIISKIPFSGQLTTIKKMLEQLQDNPNINDESYQRLENIVNKHFDENMMKQRLSKALTEKMSREELAEVLAWQETPAVSQINQINEKAMDPEYAQEMREDLKNFDFDEVSDERKDLLRRLDQATGGTKHAIDNMVVVQMSMTRAIMEKNGTPLESAENQEMSDGMRETFQNSFGSKAAKASAMLMAGFQTETLKAIVPGYETDAHQKYLEVTQEVNQKGGEKFGQAFGSELSNNESP